MAITTKIPGAPSVSLRYITIGALIAVPSGLSFVFFGTWALHPVAGYVRMCAFVLGIIFGP